MDRPGVETAWRPGRFGSGGSCTESRAHHLRRPQRAWSVPQRRSPAPRRHLVLRGSLRALSRRSQSRAPWPSLQPSHARRPHAHCPQGARAVWGCRDPNSIQRQEVQLWAKGIATGKGRKKPAPYLANRV